MNKKRSKRINPKKRTSFSRTTSITIIKKKGGKSINNKFLQNIAPLLITNPYATSYNSALFPLQHKRSPNQFTPVPPIHPNLRGQWFQRESTRRRDMEKATERGGTHRIGAP